MDSVQDLKLTWVGYSQKLTEAFNKFLTRESLCNVTLSVNRKSIKAHQAILSACSKWFEEVLMENNHPHPIIILKDVRYEDLKNIIKFIYTGEVSVPQHDLQEFLRTAELLEIKGLLRGNPSNTNATTNSLGYIEHHTHNPIAPTPTQHHAPNNEPLGFSAIQVPASSGLPSLPTAPIVLSAGPITDGGIDLVSQIKVPVSLSPQSPPVSPDATMQLDASGGLVMKQYEPSTNTLVLGKKRRKPMTQPQPVQQQQQQQNLVMVKRPRGVMPNSHSMTTVNTNTPDLSQINKYTSPQTGLLGQEEVTGSHEQQTEVNWNLSEESGATSDLNHANLTPAQIVANGVSDCGAFKRVWAERYLCYNLGREIICLLCFCRFTQFKKFNLERHMKNKHAQLYNLPESTRKLILQRYVARYEDHVTPGMVSSVPAHGNEQMASEIMSVGPIQLEELDLDLNTLAQEQELAENKPGSHIQVIRHGVNDVQVDSLKHVQGQKVMDPLGSHGDDSGKHNSLDNCTDEGKSHVDNGNPAGNLDDDNDPQLVEQDQLIVECQLNSEEQEEEQEEVLVKQEKSFLS